MFSVISLELCMRIILYTRKFNVYLFLLLDLKYYKFLGYSYMFVKFQFNLISFNLFHCDSIQRDNWHCNIPSALVGTYDFNKVIVYGALKHKSDSLLS